MIPVPSRRLVAWAAAATLGALGVLVFPGAWLLLLAFDLALAAAAFLDWLLTPGAAALDAVRVAPDRISVLSDHPVVLVVRNRSAVPLRVQVRDSVPESFDTETQELS